jgi:hypothetical protein
VLLLLLLLLLLPIFNQFLVWSSVCDRLHSKMVHRSALLLLLLNPAAAFQTTVPRAEISYQLDRRRPWYAAPRAGGGDEQPNESRWDSFKSSIYGGVDSINDLSSKLNGESEVDSDRVEEGYADFEATVKQSQAPGMKIMSEYQDRAKALGADAETSEESKTSGFDAFKKGVYNTVDASSKLFEQEETPTQPMLDRNVPYKRSLGQDFNNEDLASSNPVKRIQAEMEVREKEARMRAQLRNEDIKSKKESLYELIDSFQTAIESIPEKVEQAEKAAREAAEFVQSVPGRVDKAVEEVKAIPSKVKQTATQTKESVEESIETTKKVVEEVKDIPNKVTKKIEDTKRQVEETKESVDETVTKVKVLVGLEKPKPKPPKLPPPKEPSFEQFALDVAGGAAKGVGKFAWWAAKSTTGLAWSGAKSAFEQATESAQALPALSAAVQEQQPPKTIEIPPPSDTKEVELEVADALKLAEASLRQASVEKKKNED